MKNLWLHGIYLSIIGILGFQLWSKTTETRYMFGQVDQVLKSNNELLRLNSESMLNEIEKNYSTNPEKYEYFHAGSKVYSKLFQSALNMIDRYDNKTKLLENINLNELKDSMSILSKKTVLFITKETV